MSHCIESNDLGFLSGNSTWHGLRQYHLVGDRPVTMEEALQTVDFEVQKVPTFIEGNHQGIYLPSESYAVIRRDKDGKITVLAPAVGTRYVATHHREVLGMIDEFLLASYPLKICGAGTLNGGATWWTQLVADRYYIRGDASPNELRLSYSHTYGVDAHAIFCTTTRIVCNNTRRAGMADAVARKMMSRHKHTKSAVMKINADMELMAELHLAVQKDKELMEHLAGIQVDHGYIQAFMQEFFPKPHEDASSRSKNQWESDSRTVAQIFETGQHLQGAVQTSRYALLNAFTDWADHHSYTRDETDRWADSMNGGRANRKDLALAFLSK